MNSAHDGYNYILKLNRGEKLVESLKSFVTENNIPSCWISGLGGAEWAELAFYDLKQKTYQAKRFDEMLEIVSLQGNIAWDDAKQLVLHMHVVLGSQSMQTIGGHLMELSVGGTCEIFLHRWFGDSLQRSRDANTGLQTLNI